jgi:hypothetical protein
VLNAPTNEAWIVPWAGYLRASGVRFSRQTVDMLELRGGRIVSARVRDRDRRSRTVTADYVRTNIDAATMEGANEASRKAVNALLTISNSRAAPVPMHPLYRPRELEAAKRIDAERYRNGQTHVLDTP